MTVTGQTTDTAAMRFSLPRGQIALAFAAFLMIGGYDGTTGVLLPSLQAYYHVGKGIISLLFLGMVLGYLTASFLSGILVERLGYKRFFAAGAGIFAVGTAVISLHAPLVVVLSAALFVGFGFGSLDAGLNAYITSAPDSTSTLNLLHACYGGGALLGPLIASGILTVGQPWHRVYLLWAIIGAVLFLCLLCLFHPAGIVAPSDASLPVERNLLFAALKLRIVQIGALFLLLYVGIEVTIGSWAYSFLTEVRHGDPLHSGWVTSGYWLGLTLGRLAAATISGRFAFDNVRLIRYCLVGVLAGVFVVWLIPVGAASAIGFLLIGFSLGPIFPTTISLLPALIPGRLVPSAIGFLAGTGSAGAALFPWLAGVIAQFVGLAALMPYLVVLAVVMAGGWLVLRRTSTRATMRQEA